METSSSLNESMSKAIKHYSSLFFLPSFKRTLAALVIVCIALSLSSILPANSSQGLLYSLFLGASTFGLTVLSAYLTTNTILKKDLIFVIRRTTALSLFSWILWLAFIIPGAIIAISFGPSFWVKLCLLGFASVMTLQAVVFFSVSTAGFKRGVLASLIQPFLCIIPFLVIWRLIGSILFVETVPFLIIVPFLALASANLLVSLIDRLGRKTYGIPAMSLFRAFMLNWVLNLNAPLEQYFEKMGKDEDIEVSLLKFDTTKTKAAILVPLVHPGPFKNIGSSHLPSLLKHEFEKAFNGDACVPLGILGHELDLASQAQNMKIINTIVDSIKELEFSDTAKPFVKIKKGFVTASCQIFGDTALLAFSLSPKTTEDLPQELGDFVRQEAKKNGLRDAIVINTHNSITDTTALEESLDTLKMAASKCLEEAVSYQSTSFQIGAATIYPKNFSLKDGMGPGGITSIVVDVVEQKTAYIIIDGNNMITGLREKILSALMTIGFDDSEVFTTDTHAVNAIVLSSRGYHPIGEVLAHETLINLIKECALKAKDQLEPCKASALTMVVPKVRVIGQAKIQAFSTLVDAALQRAKRIVVPIFGLEGFLLILLLAVL